MKHTVIEISDLSLPELDIFARLTEAQLRSRLEPEKGIFIAESPKVIARALDAGCQPLAFLMERRHLDGQGKELLARCGAIPVYTADRAVLAKLTGYELTRGILCAMRRPIQPSMEELCANARRVVVLEDIVDTTNVGAIFRSAAALHMDAVLLTPACCDPLCRRAARVSMGTVFRFRGLILIKKYPGRIPVCTFFGNSASKPWQWHCGMILSALMIRSFMQKKNLPSSSAQKGMAWHPTQSQTAIIP